MLAEKVVTIAEKSAKASLRDLEEPFVMGARAIQAKWHGNGAEFIYHMQHFARELKQRAQIIWAAFYRTHNSLGSELSQTLRADLLAAFRVQLQQQWVSMQPTFEKFMKGYPQSAKRPPWPEELRASFEHEIERYEAEIDLYVSVLEAKASQPGTPPSAVHYDLRHAQIGALQTGASAIAHVVQNIGPAERQALVQAIGSVRDAIAQDAGADPRRNQELVQVADEAIAELNKESPNESKLFMTLQVLAATVQSLASARPAYEALKAAALAVGWGTP